MELKAELPHLQGVCLEVVSRKGIMERQPKLSKLQGVCQDHNLLCESHQLELAASEHPKFQDAVLWKAQMEMKPKLATLKGLHEDVVLLKGVDCKPKATSLYVAGQDVNCWKRRGKRRLEGSSLPTSYKEPTCQETYAATSTPEAHVLAVDDSNIDRKIIEGLLKTSLYKVTTVDSALRALEVLGVSAGCTTSVKPNAFEVNLIITDYCMPGMTGYDLLKTIKATTALHEIPVVIMSSENIPKRIKSCLNEGAEEFIIKPVKMSDVKRLHCHIRPLTRAPCSGSIESLGPSSICSNRKVGSPDGLQAKPSPESRSCLNGVVVA